MDPESFVRGGSKFDGGFFCCFFVEVLVEGG